MDSFQPLRIFGLTCPFLSVKSQLRKTQPMSGQALHHLNCRVPWQCRDVPSKVVHPRLERRRSQVPLSRYPREASLAHLSLANSVFIAAAIVNAWQETALQTAGIKLKQKTPTLWHMDPQSKFLKNKFTPTHPTWHPSIFRSFRHASQALPTFLRWTKSSLAPPCITKVSMDKGIPHTFHCYLEPVAFQRKG